MAMHKEDKIMFSGLGIGCGIPILVVLVVMILLTIKLAQWVF